MADQGGDQPWSKSQYRHRGKKLPSELKPVLHTREELAAVQ